LRRVLSVQVVVRRVVVVMMVVDVHLVHRLPLRLPRRRHRVLALVLMPWRLLRKARCRRHQRRRRCRGLPDCRLLPQVRMQVLHDRRFRRSHVAAMRDSS